MRRSGAGGPHHDLAGGVRGASYRMRSFHLTIFNNAICAVFGTKARGASNTWQSLKSKY